MWYKSFTLVLLITLFCGGTSRATDSPLDLVKARNLEVESVLAAAGEEVDAETKEKLKDIINGFIDFEALSRIALGKHWEQRSELEKTDFVKTFQQLIRNSSVKKLEVYKADKIVYEAPEVKEDKAKVTTVAYKKRKQVEILYKMHLLDSGWKVYDIEIDGASTARNYRESFYKQIAKSSYDEMYKKLEKRLNSK